MSDIESDQEISASRASPVVDVIQGTIPRTQNLFDALMHNFSNDLTSMNHDGENTDDSTEPNESRVMPPAGLLNWNTLTSLSNQASNLPNINRWAGFSIPNNQLITTLDVATDLIKQGLDIPGTPAGDQVEHLVSKVMIPTLQKVLFDDFTLHTDHSKAIMSCIYRVLTIFVAKLKTLRLSHDTMDPFWQMFKMVMSQNAKWYSRPVAHDIHLALAVAPGDLSIPCNILRRKSDSYDWFATVIMWFHKIGGFTEFANWLQRVPKDVSFEDFFHYIDWLMTLGQHFVVEFNKKALTSFLKPLIDKMMALTVEDINRIPLDLRESIPIRALFLTKMYLGLCGIKNTSREDYEVCYKTHFLLMKALLRAIGHGVFFGRIMAMDEFIRLFAINDVAEMNEGDLEDFIKEEHVVELLYKDNLHHLAYVERLLRIMNVLFERRLIDLSVLDIIWDSQLGKHDAIQRNVNAILSKIAVNFPDEFYTTLFLKIEKSWNGGDDKVKEVALDLMKRLGMELSISLVKDKTDVVRKDIAILWRWSTMSEFWMWREKIFSVLFDILHETVIPRRDFTILEEQIVSIAESCLDPVNCATDDDPVALCLHFLRKLICLMPDEKALEEKNRNILIRKLDEKFTLTDGDELEIFAFGIQVAQHICSWISQITPRLHDSPVNSMEISTSSSEGPDANDIYFTNLRKRLDFFHFLISEARRCYKEDFSIFQSDWFVSLWNNMIVGTPHSLQSIGFRFFRDVVTTLLDFTDRGDHAYDAHLRFFNECVLNVDPIGLSHNGFKCFSTFLKFVNISKGILKFSASMDLEDDEQEMILYDSTFEGEEYLWNVIIHSSDDLMQKQSSHLLERMYSSYIKNTASKEEKNEVIVNKCVHWLKHVDKLRNEMANDMGHRLIKNTIQAILEVVEKNESEVKLVVRKHPSLRRAILVWGYKTSITFRAEDMQMLFPPELLPVHISSPFTLSVHSNMLLYELAENVAQILTNQGCTICTYPIIIVKKNCNPNNKHHEWGYTMREVGIEPPATALVRMERSKIAVNPDTDEKYGFSYFGREFLRFKDHINPERCWKREQKFLSYQLMEHPKFIETLLQLADDGDLLECCFQLLGSLPTKRIAVFNTKDDYHRFISAIHQETSLSKRLYLTFCLYERLLPASFKDSSHLKLFFEADGVSSLLKLFNIVTLTYTPIIDYEMFFCDVLFRFVPNLVYIFLHEKELTDKLDPVMKKTFVELKQNLDPYAETLGRQFRLGPDAPDLDYDLETLLAIVNVGIKFKSNGCGDIFHSAIISTKLNDDDDTGMEDEEPGEEECDQMVFNCVNMLALLAIYKPEVGRKLLQSPEFKKFLVLCVSSEKATTNSYTMLITQLYFCVEKQLGTQDLLEDLFHNLFEQRQGKVTTAYWELLAILVDQHQRHHKRNLTKITLYKFEMVEWLNGALKETEETMAHYSDQYLLIGRLRLAFYLFECLSSSEKAELGLPKGQNLIEKLIYNFLIPSSKEFLQLKQKENGIGMVRSQTAAPKESEIDFALSVPRSTSCLLPTRAVSVCKLEDSQIAAYNLLNVLGDSPECLQAIVRTIDDLFYDGIRSSNFIPENLDRRGGFIQWDYQPDNNLRSPGNFVGLKNGGATCYMNSILQQLYMIPEIRDPILNVFISDDLSEQAYQVKILAAIQSVFANLAGSELEAYTPDEFWAIFKLNERVVNVHEQQDAYEFYNKVVDLIDEGMDKLGAPKVGTTVFGGLFADEKICKDCPHRYSREEPFTSISIDVRSHNNMIDSLTEFVRGDVLENDNAYHCEKCDKKVRAVKRLTIKSLPDTLVIQLKRFEFDWERNEPVKFNDYFEFPFTLDMRPYTTEAMNAKDNSDSELASSPIDVTEFESSIYNLKGVVVHSGQATGGHYFSYIKSNSTNSWFKFDDTEVTNYPCEPTDVKLKWYGEEPSSGDYVRRRPRVWWNAFVLFYEKEITPVSISRPLPTPYTLSSGVPLTLPLTVDPNMPTMDGSRRSSTASPVTRLHKRLSNLSLRYGARLIPARLEVKVRNMNTKIMHEKNEFSFIFFDFINNLMGRHCKKYIQNEELIKALLALISKFMFYTMIRAGNVIRREVLAPAFEKEQVVTQLCDLFNTKFCRMWFINNVVLDEELSRSFLLGLQTKYVYARILIKLIAKTWENEDKIDDLRRAGGTTHLTNVLNKRRLSSFLVFDLLVESLVVLLREEHNEELDLIFSQIYLMGDAKLIPHLLRCGYLSAAVRYLDSYHFWDHFTFLPAFQLTMACFRYLDIRLNVKRHIIVHEDHLQRNPHLAVDEDEAVRLDQCLDGIEIIHMLSGQNNEKMGKFVEIIINQLVREHNPTVLHEAVKCICWNNLLVMKRTVVFIIKYLCSQNVDFHFENLFPLFYDLMNSKDQLHEDRKILRLIIEHELPAEYFNIGSPGHRMAQVPFMKSEAFRKRLIIILVIALEAFSRHEDEDWLGPSINDTIRESDENFFKYFSDMLSGSKEVVRKTDEALKDIFKYMADVPALPTDDDLKVRLLIKCREFETPTEDEDLDECSEESDQDMDIDKDGDGEHEQPLDLTLGMSRSSVNTPMIAEKRTLLQEDDDTPNEPAEPKKSRYSDNGDEEFLIHTSTSAVEFQEKNASDAPPPPYGQTEDWDI